MFSELPHNENSLADWYAVATAIAHAVHSTVRTQPGMPLQCPEDYAQEVFLTFWEKLTAGEIRSSAKGYLKRMLHNRMLDDLRKHHIRYVAFDLDRCTCCAPIEVHQHLATVRDAEDDLNPAYSPGFCDDGRNIA